MTAEDERCAEARKLERIDDAFRKGDLDGLRAALDNQSVTGSAVATDTLAVVCVMFAPSNQPGTIATLPTPAPTIVTTRSPADRRDGVSHRLRLTSRST
jgi:hypothetical protein